MLLNFQSLEINKHGIPTQRLKQRSYVLALFTLLLLIVSSEATCSSQITYTISKSSNYARSVFAIDIDRDGDIDLAAVSYQNGKIAWYENTNKYGNGSTWEYHEIDDGINGLNSVFAIDMDTDGDIDLLASCSVDQKIIWFENTNKYGNGSTWTYHEISGTNDLPDNPYSVFAIDIDGDGDIDVASASFDDSRIAWHENTNEYGNGSTWTYHEVYTDANGATGIFAIDIDGDGDIDLASSSAYDDKIAWYENTNIHGDGSAWTYHEVYEHADYADSIFAIDIDGDGDIDLASASSLDNTIAWYENTNIHGDGSAWTYHEVYKHADYARSIFAIDMDGDGDIDLASAAFNNNTIAWHENTNAHGDGSAWTYHEVDTAIESPASVFAIDIDNDGDIDLASGSFDEIRWHEMSYSCVSTSVPTVAPTPTPTPIPVPFPRYPRFSILVNVLLIILLFMFVLLLSVCFYRKKTSTPKIMPETELGNINNYHVVNPVHIGKD